MPPALVSCMHGNTCPAACPEDGEEGQPLVLDSPPPAAQSERDRAIDAEALAILMDGTTDRQPQLPVLKLGLLVLMFAGVPLPGLQEVSPLLQP